MVPDRRIDGILEDYDKDELVIATLCSHSSLQIFHGAKKLGFRTMGITVTQDTKHYDAFPLARPDEFVQLSSYDEMLDKADFFVENNVIIIPHGSFVEYLGPKKFERMDVPSFGNRKVLAWESDRDKEREWLTSAGVSMPEIVNDAEHIDRPVLVKYHGAKGGRGFFIAKDHNDFKLGIEHNVPYTMQEYVLGTRYYLHFFYSPIVKEGYHAGDGTIEMLSIDRRDESNIDEMYKLGAQEELKKHQLYPSFVVTGNVPVVIRESLLPKAFEMAERIVNRSIELFGGMVGPFCLESIVTDKLEFKVFEISSRIVAGTNPFINGSPYSEMIHPGMSTGMRIAKEIQMARDMDALDLILS